MNGPVSEVLERDVRAFVRKHGIVVWLDADGHYTQFVEQLKAEREAGTLPYSVHCFRRSHLALMIELEQVASGTERPPLLVHLPGFNTTTVSNTPLLELYSAGRCYQKGLDTLVSEAAAGVVRPEEIERFKQQPGLTLDGADGWLQSQAVAQGGGIAAELQRLTPTAFLEDLLARGAIAAQLGTPESDGAVWERAEVWVGLAASWRTTALSSRPEDVAFTLAGWCLAVEYVDDLRREPVNPNLTRVRALPKAVIEQGRRVAVYLREHQAAFYRRVADEVESLLHDEVEQANARDLGSVDTFRFEEDKILDGALAALAEADWALACEWSRARVENTAAVSFWLREDVERLAVWQLVYAAAWLGQQLARAGTTLWGSKRERSLEGAVERYVEFGAGVDQAHRQLEQKRVALLEAALPKFEELRARLDQMRERWRTWADAWAREFNAVCKQEGFLPAAALRQCTLFDEVVRPMTQESGTTAYFVVDAFRFEMAAELFAKLEGAAATTCQLKPRLAELPSVTEVGMNVLAPAQQNGKLFPAFSSAQDKILGFQTAAEFRVHDAETRKRAMHDRVGGNTCPWLSLDDVVERDSPSLKRTVAQARLLVVHSDEIDKAGEKGVGPAVFDVVMQKLRSAWGLLRDAGVRRFVFAADHGFLLLDGAAREVQAHGRKIDPDRRHVFSSAALDHTGEVRVAFSELGYENAPGYVMFPEGTAMFDQGRKGTNFFHGGNSLQERVIPVLTVVHRAAAGGTVAEFGVVAEVADGVAGMHCLVITVQPVQTSFLEFGGPKALELGLQVEQAPEVQIELCQTRGSAKLESGAIVATVGQRFEVFFKLRAAVPGRVQVAVVPRTVQAKLESCVIESWFEVTPTRPSQSPASSRSGEIAVALPAVALVPGKQWAQALPEGGVREVFLHLDTHRSITESELASMLGGQRGARKFANLLDEYQRKTPFRVRIEVVAGLKHYIKEEH